MLGVVGLVFLVGECDGMNGGEWNRRFCIPLVLKMMGMEVGDL